jgi:uncharacterized protein (DUF1778 family)
MRRELKLFIRVSAEELAEFQKAAAIERRPVADFVRYSAWLRAQQLAGPAVTPSSADDPSQDKKGS